MTAFVRSLNALRGGISCRFNADIGKCSLLERSSRVLSSMNLSNRYQHNIQHRSVLSRCMSTEQSSSLSVPPHQKSDVLSAVRSDINQGRMFAIVYISGAQHKVTTGDLVLLQNHIKADVGDIIRLEKILLLGGDNFTLIGKPMLSLDTVRVEATVIEKTVSEKKVHFRFKRRKRFSSYRERQTDLTVLRINSIEAQLR
ncbi:large ribosomal subunit protein bL21m-like [Lytechinus pictus]|uniref:large ribosomal subunit protein bL21m-like n=1 Tax=Lytechinus pictus TaxID=7653 RepID=UPI0030B9ECC2